MADTNPYLQLLDEDEQRRKAQQSATLATAVDVKPDTYATQKRVAGYLGYPVAAVEATPDESQREAQLKQIQTDTAEHPVLQRRYSDEDFAKLAHDDSSALANVAETLKQLAKFTVSAEPGRGVVPWMASGVLDMNRGAAGIFQAGAEALAPVLEPFAPKILGHSTNPLTQVAGFFAREGAGSKSMAERISAQPGDMLEAGLQAGVRSLTTCLQPIGDASNGGTAA